MSKPDILLAIRYWKTEAWLARFQKAAPDRRVHLWHEREAPPQDYYLCAWKPDPAVFHLEPRPRLVMSLGAGVDHIMTAHPPAGIPITRIVDPDLTGRMVEYVVLHALYHFRRMNEYAAAQYHRHWLSLDQPAARDVTVGIMGVGEMGVASAAGLQAVGFNVIGWGRTPRTDVPFESYHGDKGLVPFLQRTDILVSLLPSTPQTRGLIGRDVFSHLRHPGPIGGPCFINAGRGDTVRENELVSALTDGTLRAASLDVFAVEPLPAIHPLWTLPNVVITPHCAADSSPEAVVSAVMAEIDRYEQGLPPLYQVDHARGY